MKAMVENYTSSVHGCIKSSSGCIGAYRFYNNNKVSEQKLINKSLLNTQSGSIGKRLIIISDTTEYNFENHRRRIDCTSKKIGLISDNKSLGFLGHNLLAVNRDTNDIVGWADILLFNRAIDNEAHTRENWTVPIQEKESNKWITTSLKARDKVLNLSSHKLFVTDRESDIYEYLSLVPDEQTDILLRAWHNRRVKTMEGKKVKVFDDIDKRAIKGEIKIQIKDNKNRQSRLAECEIRFCNYVIECPSKKIDKHNYKPSLTLAMVSVKEKTSPPGEDPVEWYLWTSETVTTLEQGVDKIRCYKQRWKIEEAHRLLKSEGFKIENSELESPQGIRKLLIMGMEASIKIQQLKEAREGNTSLETKEVFEQQEVQCLEKLNMEYEGNTEKQKNPYPKNSLAWASWIIARIGGWKGYASQRKPGTITYKRGYERFTVIMQGYKLNFPP
jgi:hypothetical protein